jgi:hypothetical protein
MRCLLVAVALVLATPALAANATQAAAPVAVAAPRRATTTTMHYPTLEKMLRRFSRQAGETRTRG